MSPLCHFLGWPDSFHDKTTNMLASWLYYLEPYKLYMTIRHRAGTLHGNTDLDVLLRMSLRAIDLDVLSRMNKRTCPWQIVLILVITWVLSINFLPRMTLLYILDPIMIWFQRRSNISDSICTVVALFIVEVAQVADTDFW